MKASQCVECGREVKLRAKDQMVPVHKRNTFHGGKERCPGSEQPPFFGEIDAPAKTRREAVPALGYSRGLLALKPREDPCEPEMTDAEGYAEHDATEGR